MMRGVLQPFPSPTCGRRWSKDRMRVLELAFILPLANKSHCQHPHPPCRHPLPQVGEGSHFAPHSSTRREGFFILFYYLSPSLSFLSLSSSLTSSNSPSTTF